MRKIIMSSQKGGTGKTTTAVNLAAIYGLMGRRTLVVDLDTQGNATTNFGVEEHSDALYRLMVDNEALEDVIAPTNYEGVDVIASGDVTDQIQGLLSVNQSPEDFLRERLEPLEESYDFVILDAPTGTGFMTKSGMLYAKELLVTFDGTLWAKNGTKQTFDLMQAIRSRRRLNPELVLLGVLITGRDLRLKNQERYIEEAKAEWGEPYFLSTIIRTDASLGRAQGQGPVIYTHPGTKAAVDYCSLAEEILQRNQ